MGASLSALGLAAAVPAPEVTPGRRPRQDQPAQGTGLVYDDRFLDHVLPLRQGQEHPERPLRLQRIREAFAARGLDQELVDVAVLGDPFPQIEAHHTAAHVAAVRQIETTGAVSALAVAGALGAVDAVARRDVRNVFCAMRPPGHHANNAGAEEGFCFYSNAAIAAKYAQQMHGYDRVLIVDWDYHHGNGTQNAFYDDPSVLFFSTHDWHAYPGTGDPGLGGAGDAVGSNINVHLDCGARDADMLTSWDRQLLPAVGEFRPDFVIISAGFDSRHDDLLGCFDVTDDAFRRMTRTVMDMADDFCDGRVVSILEGGYNVDGSALAAAAHVETLLDSNPR
jgi:acetoin utilization deacetylase AcuC-like enzyme